MEDCTEPHQIWDDTLGEQSRNQVGTTVPAAMGPCAPSEPVLYSSGFADASEHAAISLVVSKLASNARYLMDKANLVEMAQYERSLYTSARSLHKLVNSELNRCL